MIVLTEALDAIREFMDTGGIVLSAIGFMIFAMWILILERIMHAVKGYKVFEKDLVSKWTNRADRNSWNAEQIRQAYIGRAKATLNYNLPIITTLVALCPMMGLLGTVTGMIEVFDVMAISGSGNARSMASGVSKATIPTMAGMVGALSGIFANTWLQRNAKREIELLQDHLPLDH